MVGRRIDGQGMEVRLDVERLFQQPVKFLAVDFDGAELAQMVGDELRVEQREAAVDRAARRDRRARSSRRRAA